MEPLCKATEPYAFTILTPGVESTGGQAYKRAAENQEELRAWLWALAGVSCRRLCCCAPWKPSTGSCAKWLAKSSAHPQGMVTFLLLSVPSFQELHEQFGKEIQVLLAVNRGLQGASDRGGSRSQRKMKFN